MASFSLAWSADMAERRAYAEHVYADAQYRFARLFDWRRPGARAAFRRLAPGAWDAAREAFAHDAVVVALRRRLDVADPLDEDAWCRWRATTAACAQDLDLPLRLGLPDALGPAHVPSLACTRRPPARPARPAYPGLGAYHGWTTIGLAVYDLDAFPDAS